MLTSKGDPEAVNSRIFELNDSKRDKVKNVGGPVQCLLLFLILTSDLAGEYNCRIETRHQTRPSLSMVEKGNISQNIKFVVCVRAAGRRLARQEQGLAGNTH